MPNILLTYSDGLYSTRVLEDDDAIELGTQGHDVAHVEERVLAAWHRHCDEASAWQALWRAFANALDVGGREHTLGLLGEAQREINRLREELARAQREPLYREEDPPP